MARDCRERFALVAKPARRALPLVLLGVVAVAGALAATGGCERPGRDARVSDAEALMTEIADEVRRAGVGEESPLSRSRAGNAFTRGLSIELPADRFSPDQLPGVVDEAVKRWGALGTYQTHGGPGIGLRNEPGLSASRSGVHFGNDRSHAFVEAVCYPFGEVTRVEIAAYVLE